MKRNVFIYIVCFTLMAALAVTFITAAGTAVLAGHCGRVAANDPFSALRSVLKKPAVSGGAGNGEKAADAPDVQAAAIDDGAERDARLAELTAKIALALLALATVVVTAAFIIRGRKR